MNWDLRILFNFISNWSHEEILFHGHIELKFGAIIKTDRYRLQGDSK